MVVSNVANDQVLALVELHGPTEGTTMHHPKRSPRSGHRRRLTPDHLSHQGAMRGDPQQWVALSHGEIIWLDNVWHIAKYS